MAKGSKGLKKKQAGNEEALKKKLLLSMKKSLEIDDSDEASENEDEEMDVDIKDESKDVSEDDPEEADQGDDEGDDVEGEVEYEESDDDEPNLNKSVYQDSANEDSNEEEVGEDEELEKKPVKSVGPTPKKIKLTEPEEVEDSDDEVTEEPIKRQSDVKGQPLKRKKQKVSGNAQENPNKSKSKKLKVEIEDLDEDVTEEPIEQENSLKRKRGAATSNSGNKEDMDNESISIEELPLTCIILNLPFGLKKNDVIDILRPHTQFKRIFYQIQRTHKNYFVVFENNEQLENMKEKEIPYEDTENPKVAHKNIKLFQARWTSFYALIDHCVCVKGLDTTITEEQLEESLKSFGKVLKVDISKQSKGVTLKFPYACVLFENVESAAKALESQSVKIGELELKLWPMRNKQPKIVECNDIGIQGDLLTIEECERAVCVKNATRSITNQQITQALSKFGKVDRVRGFDNNNKIYSRYFYVLFADNEGYDKALEAKNIKLCNKNISIIPLKWGKIPEIAHLVVKVFGIPLEVTTEQLKSKFEECGKVIKIEHIKLKDNQQSLAFVFFDNNESVEKALSLNGCLFENRKLTVSRKTFTVQEFPNTVFVKKPFNSKMSLQDVETALKVFGKVKKINEGVRHFVVSFVRDADGAKALKNKTIQIAGVAVKLNRYKIEHSKSFGVVLNGFSETTSIDDILQHFKDCGEIKKSYIGTSKRTSVNFAFLEFTNAQGKIKALSLNKSLLNGESIFVKNSKSRFNSNK